MSFEEKKVPTFEHPISQLADQPNMQPGELKAYFDANPEILRQGLNALCDALGDTTAAANLGFTQTAGVPESTVQDAIENVQSQLDAAVMGNIPSGSVTGDKLAQDVRDRFSAIESAATTEASTRANADSTEASIRAQTDSSLQSQINTLSATKCELYTGTYVGNSTGLPGSTQSIVLGFRPKAVLVMRQGFLLERLFSTGQMSSIGGIAIEGWSNTGIALTDSGFEVRQCFEENDDTGMDTTEVNTSGYTYVYLAFR